MVVISSRAYGQSSALTECTRAFYRGDYALAVQLAEKHLRKYPKDVPVRDRKSTRLNSSHSQISYAVFCLKKKKIHPTSDPHRESATATDSTQRPTIVSVQR